MKSVKAIRMLPAHVRLKWTLFLSALLLVVASWVVGAALGVSSVAPYIALLAFALITYRLTQRYAQQRGVDVERALLQDIQGASAEAQAFISGLQKLLAQQIHYVDDETSRLQAIIGDAINKLVGNFSAVNDLIRRQQSITSELSERVAVEGAAQPVAAALQQQDFEGVARIVDEINAQVNSAITALQFHDMSSQLLDHIRKRLIQWNSLTQSTEDVTVMSRDGWKVLLETLRKCNEQLEELDHVPVSQSDVDSGEIEFF